MLNRMMGQWQGMQSTCGGKKLELLCPPFSFFFCEGNKVSTFLFLYEKNNLNDYMYIQIYKDIIYIYINIKYL